MDFGFTPVEEAWREEVRDFLRENPPEKFPLEHEDDGFGMGGSSKEFMLAVANKGWLNRSWPKEFGGQDRPLMEYIIMLHEFAYARAPAYSFLMSDSLAHNIIKYGNDFLKKEFLPKLPTGELVVWLGFSEPDAGSDLLNLKTVARKENGYYVLNGQKVWSTFAHLSDFSYLLVLTNPEALKRHQGLSILLLDKKLPGVTVRPLINLIGTHYHNEVFLDNVRVPEKYLLGQENGGFYLMLAGLESDRYWARMVKAPWCQRLIEELVVYTKETSRGGSMLAKDTLTRHRLAESAVEIEACDLIFYRMSRMLDQGQALTYEGSLGKLYADEMGQRLLQLAMQILGPYGQLDEDSKWAQLRGSVARWYQWSIGWTLAGGTSEIQRNTLATLKLKMPRS